MIAKSCCWMARLAKYSPFYDGDSAGIHASLRGIDMILKEGMNVRVVLLPEPEDPDSFARSHTASEVQAYIRDHERDFLEFKANLLLQDAEGDPIRKAALIGDMVQSIAQIPDPIQRSVYVKECARIMDIDENILISEVARKRLTTSGDREADEFLRRQAAQRQREAAQPEVEYVRKVEAGSGFEALEREIVKYLLKYGHCSFDFKEGRTMVACNVAEVSSTSWGGTISFSATRCTPKSWRPTADSGSGWVRGRRSRRTVS